MECSIGYLLPPLKPQTDEAVGGELATMYMQATHTLYQYNMYCV